MAPPARGAREQKLSDGLRKLQEFQRRKEQSAVAASASSTSTETTIQSATSSQQQPQPSLASRQGLQDAILQQAQYHSTPSVDQSPPQMAGAITQAAICAPLTSTAAVVSPVTVSSSTDGELGPRLQNLISQLAAVAASGATRDLRQLEELQRHCVQLAREADEAQRGRQGQAAQLDSLRASHSQATRTIELLVEEKSRLQTAVDSLERQLRVRAHEALVRDAEIRSLRERATINDGQIARLLKEKEQWTRKAQAGGAAGSETPPLDGAANSTVETSYTNLQKQVLELEEQLRLSAEKIAQLQRTEEQSRTAYDAARNELEVAQAYVRQLAGTSGDESADNLNKAEATRKALESQLERLREELETEVHERNAADLIARNLEASNRGLQQRVVELERAAAASITAQSQPLQTVGSSSLGYDVEQRDVGSQTDADDHIGTRADADMRLMDLAEQNKQFQTELYQLQEQLCSERGLWSEQTMVLKGQIATNADELQRAKVDASRAVSQNRQLKSQIEELQDVFVKLSNDKLDLTEDVHRERYRAQQLEARLRDLETTIELQQAQATEKGKDELGPSSVAIEAFEHNASTMDSQLQQYALQVQRLEAQLTECTSRYASLERQNAQCTLKHKAEARLHQQQPLKYTYGVSRITEDEGSRSLDTSQTLGDSPGGSLSLSEYEFVDTAPHGTHQPSARNAASNSDSDAVNNNNSDTSNHNADTAANVYYTGAVVDHNDSVGGDLAESIGDAMYSLDNLSTTSSRNEKTSHEMDQPTKVPMGTPVEAVIEREHERRLTEAALKITRLQDEKSQLEHQVEQLRMETDTISDYIQLYQQQRAALNQRQRERDAQIKQLLEDREALSSKVNQLQSLIGKILPMTSSQQNHQQPQKPAHGNPTAAFSPVPEQASKGTAVVGSTSSDPTSNEVIAHKILQTLEDLTEVSTAPPAGLNTFYRCSSCQGCHGKLLSL